MNVTSGITLQDPEVGTYRKLSVNLGWQDLLNLAAEKRLAGYHVSAPEPGFEVVADDGGAEMSVMLQYAVLQAEADMLLWHQAFSEGLCQREVALDKIQKSIARTHGVLRVAE